MGYLPSRLPVAFVLLGITVNSMEAYSGVGA